MSKIYVGIDNGTTGTITILYKKDVITGPMLIKKELSYTKKKQYITRIHWKNLKTVLKDNANPDKKGEQCDIFCLMERPMINPMRFKQSISAARALEATLIVLEELDISHDYIDSKEWQSYFLPKGILKLKSKKKSAELKRAAVDVARRLFPKIKTKDADSLLIAEYARRMGY